VPLVACRQCGESLDEAFRFCPWCAAPLGTRLVEFFRAHRRLLAARLR
jgi:predicted amidophosphoribosyltransferase